ncbi:MAG: cupredoxin domain-containing protein [bacterium]|nr:cupredoxin domain-containing protein [bacterium]
MKGQAQTLLLVIVAVLVIGGAIFFASQGGSSTSPTPTSTPVVEQPTGVTQEVKTFEVEGKPFEYNPKEIMVKKGDRVRIVFKNTQGFHDLTIGELGVHTKQIQAGQSDTIEFVADKAGTFEYYCSVPTHKDMGMTGKLIVEE